MAEILKFEDFINESYLSGGRPPLYHSTHYFTNILKSDLLKANKPAFDVNNRKSISFTRDRYYGDGGPKKFMVDVDHLIKDGYKPTPVDEVGSALNKRKSLGLNDKPYQNSYSKVNPRNKTIVHNIAGLETGNDLMMSQESEERIYKDIPNFGRYVIEIILPDDSVKRYKPELEDYLTQYPHIVVKNNKGTTLLTHAEIVKSKSFTQYVSTDDVLVESSKAK